MHFWITLIVDAISLSWISEHINNTIPSSESLQQNTTDIVFHDSCFLSNQILAIYHVLEHIFQILDIVRQLFVYTICCNNTASPKKRYLVWNTATILVLFFLHCFCSHLPSSLLTFFYILLDVIKIIFTVPIFIFPSHIVKYTTIWFHIQKQGRNDS